MTLKLPRIIRFYLEYRYWRRKGYFPAEARRRARNTF